MGERDVTSVMVNVHNEEHELSNVQALPPYGLRALQCLVQILQINAWQEQLDSTDSLA